MEKFKFLEFFQDYGEGNSNYEHFLKQHIMNLQEAQRSMNKKSDDSAVSAPLSGPKIQKSLSELKEGCSYQSQ